MGKRSRLIEDDDLDESSSEDSQAGDEGFNDLDPDERAERERFGDPYGNRKRRKQSKQQRRDQALFGVFADEEEDIRPSRTGKAMKVNKSVNFVKSSVAPENPVDVDTLDQIVTDDVLPGTSQAVDEADDDMDESESDSEDEEVAPAPRIRSASPEEPVRAGFGAGRGGPGAQAGLGSAAGLGAPRNGIGSAPSTDVSRSATPTAFGGNQRKQQSFLGTPSSATPRDSQPVKLDHKEKQHFAKLAKEGSLGYRLLASQGWKAGVGLGQEGRGIVAPIESQLRPRGMGIGHEGFKERTQQAIKEAKRQGKHISDDEDEKTANRAIRDRRGGSPSERSNAWKKAKQRKPKIEYKTYEEILAAAGQSEATDGGLGQIVDLTGAQLPSLASTLTISGQPVFDDSRLPELRHNLRLIRDLAKGSLDVLAKEANAGIEKRTWIGTERRKIEKRTAEENAAIIRLKAVLAHIEELDLLSKAAVKAPGSTSHRLATFDTAINRLLDSEDFVAQGLDEAVVAAVAPTLKRAWQSWEPLEEPDMLVPQLSKWRLAFRIDRQDHSANGQIDTYGQLSTSRAPRETDESSTMTPYEALIWNHWLPRVRSAINGTWTPAEPTVAIGLLQTWKSLLPRFVHDNILDQLVLPKLSKAIGDWTPRRSTVPLHSILFPWLPHLGGRLDEIVDEAKRRFKSVVKSWRPEDGVPKEFMKWQKLFSKSEWDTLLLQYVLPPLGLHLRNRFAVNPRDQKLGALEDVIDWRDILRSSMLSQLLEAEFVPKWLDALYTWLVAAPNHEQISDWYKWWKQWLSDQKVIDLLGIQAGLGKALNLMNSAMSLGEDAQYLLERPDTRPTSSVMQQAVASQVARQDAAAKFQEPHGSAAAAPEMSFRSLVEAVCAENDLVFMPLNRAHPVIGAPLFRVSTVGKKTGPTVYLADDVVWCQVPREDRYEPIGLDDMVGRAKM